MLILPFMSSTLSETVPFACGHTLKLIAASPNRKSRIVIVPVDIGTAGLRSVMVFFTGLHSMPRTARSN